MTIFNVINLIHIWNFEEKYKWNWNEFFERKPTKLFLSLDTLKNH